MPPLSVPDLAFVCDAACPADALRNSLDLARHAERLGYPTVRRDMQELAERTRADELIVAAAIYDHQARLRSYEILAKYTDL